MKSFRLNPKAGVLFLALVVVLSFQQCSKVAVSDLGSESLSSGTDVVGQGEQPVDTPLQNRIHKAVLKADQSPLDIILVVDNSGSMEVDSLHLADRLEGFVQALEASAINWQMCLIQTSNLGAVVRWSGSSTHILNSQVSNLGSIFRQTISQMSFSGNGDERGVASLSKNLDARASNGCYRSQSVVTTIVISDEDERSMGGVWDIYEGLLKKSILDQQFRQLEHIDHPKNYIAKFKDVLPMNKLISNSIVVPTADPGCHAQQLKDSASFYGKQYELLSQLTGGSVGSICAADYAPVLSQFASVIKRSFKDVELECVPEGPIRVISSNNSALSWSLNHKTVSFESELAQDLPVEIDYQCR